MKKKKKTPQKIYFADIETTQPNEFNRVRCYLWAVVSDNETYTGDDITGLVNFIIKNKGIYYFHNLKFDFSYIHFYCLENNIKIKLLEKRNIIYSVNIGGSQLRDSLNFLTMTLREIGENYCTHYKKTSIDYATPYNHTATEEEKIYCINDCLVLQEGFNNYINSLKEVLIEAGCEETLKTLDKKLTNAGISFEAFKELSLFEKVCPKTTHGEFELYKGAYHGGYVYSKPRGVVENVGMIDCNSMYPYIYATIDMPYGKGFIINDIEKLKKYKFYIIKVNIKYDLKPGYIPIISRGRSVFGSTEYAESSDGLYEEHTFANKDFELICEFYEVDFDLIFAVGFDTQKEFYKKYADTFIKMKNQYKGVKRNVVKILLNSPYGKTAMNGFNVLKDYSIENGELVGKITGYEIDDNGFQFLPQGIAITSGARHLLLTTARNIGFNRVQYMDTDSIKFTGPMPTNIDIDENKLGAWKFEGLAYKFKTLSPKKYICYMDLTKNCFNQKITSKGIYITCAGFNKKQLSQVLCHNYFCGEEKATQIFNKFDYGFAMDCLQSKKLTGGRALIEVRKEIKH